MFSIESPSVIIPVFFRHSRDNCSAYHLGLLLVDQAEHVKITSLHFNPLTPTSNWLLISPHSMRTIERISDSEGPDCLTNSPCLYHRKCREHSVENINVRV